MRADLLSFTTAVRDGGNSIRGQLASNFSLHPMHLCNVQYVVHQAYISFSLWAENCLIFKKNDFKVTQNLVITQGKAPS